MGFRKFRDGIWSRYLIDFLILKLDTFSQSHGFCNFSRSWQVAEFGVTWIDGLPGSCRMYAKFVCTSLNLIVVFFFGTHKTMFDS